MDHARRYVGKLKDVHIQADEFMFKQDLFAMKMDIRDSTRVDMCEV
jgi:hypothetical protein